MFRDARNNELLWLRHTDPRRRPGASSSEVFDQHNITGELVALGV